MGSVFATNKVADSYALLAGEGSQLQCTTDGVTLVGFSEAFDCSVTLVPVTARACYPTTEFIISIV